MRKDEAYTKEDALRNICQLFTCIKHTKDARGKSNGEKKVLNGD